MTKIVNLQDGWINADISMLGNFPTTRPGCPKCKFPLIGQFYNIYIEYKSCFWKWKNNKKRNGSRTHCPNCGEDIVFTEGWLSKWGIA
jgi:hypothetical protein